MGRPAEGTTTTRGSNIGCCCRMCASCFIIISSVSACYTSSHHIFMQLMCVIFLLRLHRVTRSRRLLRPEICPPLGAAAASRVSFVRQDARGAAQECLTKAQVLCSRTGFRYSAGTRSQCSPQQWDKWSRGVAAQAPPPPAWQEEAPAEHCG